MRVGIDALYWLPNSMGGTQTYFLSLIRSLSARFPKSDYVVYLNGTARSHFLVDAGNISVNASPIGGRNRIVRLSWENIVLPRLAHSDGLDVFHALGYMLPRGISMPSVVTVLDMIHFVRSQDIHGPKVALWRLMFPDSLRRADLIAAISNSVKNDICEFFPWAEDKIFVTPLAVDHRLFLPRGLSEDHEPARFSAKPYILGVASLAPHKNLDGLIRSYAIIQQRFPDVDLYLVGMKRKTYVDLIRLVKELRLEAKVRFTGRIPEQELVHLYQNAEMLIFPSYYEGFGLPVLEAMACGCPVIASNRYSIPEVAGNAALLVDPDSVDQIADAGTLLLQSTELRKALSAKGFQHAQRFTWEQTAESTYRLYESLTPRSGYPGI